MRQLSVENKTISIVCMHKELKINLKFHISQKHLHSSEFWKAETTFFVEIFLDLVDLSKYISGNVISPRRSLSVLNILLKIAFY